MHIPDGFLDTKTVAISAGLSLAGVSYALNTIRKSVTKQRIPMIGLAAAFVFAAQMLNFPVMGGTSGHLIGSVLVAVILGPGAAILVMTSILLCQCFLFADGGVTALGANIFNMAIVGTAVGYSVYRIVYKIGGVSIRSRLVATAFASWVSTVAAAISCSGQLAMSGTVAWNVAFPAMVNVHMLIGIGEALITTLVIFGLVRSRPELFEEHEPNRQALPVRQIVVLGLIVSVGLTIFIAPFASSSPDGLEKVATFLGFESKAVSQPLLPAPMVDYSIPGLGSAVTSTIIAGVLGTLVAFTLALVLARHLTKPERSK